MDLTNRHHQGLACKTCRPVPPSERRDARKEAARAKAAVMPFISQIDIARRLAARHASPYRLVSAGSRGRLPRRVPRQGQAMHLSCMMRQQPGRSQTAMIKQFGEKNKHKKQWGSRGRVCTAAGTGIGVVGEV
eukprot:11137968-Karenia_brevis.AAC.1